MRLTSTCSSLSRTLPTEFSRASSMMTTWSKALPGSSSSRASVKTIFMRASIKMVFSMAMEDTFGRMDLITKANGKTARKKERAKMCLR